MPISVIGPIVTMIALFITHMTGIVLSDEEIKVIIDGIVGVGLAGMAVGGIIAKYRTGKDLKSKGE